MSVTKTPSNSRFRYGGTHAKQESPSAKEAAIKLLLILGRPDDAGGIAGYNSI